MVQNPVDMKEVWISGPARSFQEAKNRMNQRCQETSTGTSVDFPVTEGVINKNSPCDDFDIQTRKKKNVQQRVNELGNNIRAKVVSLLLSFLGRPITYSYTLAMCLIIPKEGFKDLKEEGSESGIDSGIHSNVGLVLLAPSPVDLQEDSPPQKEGVDHGLEIESVSRFGALSQGERARTDTEEQEVRRGREGESSQFQVQDRRLSGRGPVFNPLPLQYLQPGPAHDVRIGDKHDITMFVNDLSRASVDSGVFLFEYAPVYDINRRKISYVFGDDYVHISTLQQDKVYLCRSLTTGNLFVTKWVAMKLEDLPVRPGENQQQVYRLQHRQQVELVVGQQDVCSGLAKIHGVMKRQRAGRDFAEIFMEYCPGGTFEDNKDFLWSLNMYAKWRLTQKIIDIIEHLHNQTIVHGDIKPTNMTFRSVPFDVAFIDFESGKHPNYSTKKLRATYLYLPPWFRICFNSNDFSLLKTMDMWSIGMVLLNVVFGRQLWAKEYSQLLHCDSCDMRDGKCLHVQSKFLGFLESRHSQVKIGQYLPCIRPNDDPIQKRLACVIYGLLPVCGRRAQLTATEAMEALDDKMVAVLVLKDGRPAIPPMAVKHGTRIRAFLQSHQIQNLKSLYDDLEDGMWFTAETQSDMGLVKEMSVTKNQQLTESCVLHVYPPIGPTLNSTVK